MHRQRRFARAIFLAVAIALSAHTAFAQPPQLDDSHRRAVIEKTIALVGANYVFPEQAKHVGVELRKNERAGNYKADGTMDEFLEHLNRDLQTAGRDKHLKVQNNPRVVAELAREAEGKEEVAPAFLSMLTENNFRLRRVESLDGNIGYFKFDNFVELRFVKDGFVGAMNFLHYSSALILDLTDNGGGASETSDFLISYFLPEGTRVGETWSRTTNETKPSIVARAPEVKPMTETPLVILVGERTASAAEAVAYTLQQAKRAVIVGSRTKGLANPGRLFPIDDQLFLMVPTNLHRNAVSGTNWEGVGVVPEIAVAPDRAFPAAMVTALHAAADRKADAKEQYRLRFLAQEYAAAVSPESAPPGFLEACVGNYEEGRTIELQGDALHFKLEDTDRRLSYMADNTFTVDGRKDYRIQFDVEKGLATGFRVLWFDDTEERYGRTR